MRSEYDILEALKAFITDNIKDYYDCYSHSDCLGKVTGDNVLIDFPDTDNLPRNVSFYLVQDYGNHEEQTTQSDLATQSVSVLIFCKGDRQSSLIKKANGYFTAFYALVRSNPTIGGAVDQSTIPDYDFYPQVGMTPGIVGIEATLLLQWQKDF